MKFNFIDTLTKFERPAEDWRRLHAEGAQRWNVFAGYEWHKTYLQHFLNGSERDNARLAIVVACDGRKVQFICPLVCQQLYGVKVLNWIGDPVSQYGDIIFGGETEQAQLLQHALKFAVSKTGADIAVLRNVREDSAAGQTLKSMGSQILRKEIAPFIDLSGFKTLEEYLTATQRASRRKQHRRLWRRLAEQGSADFKILTAGPEAAKWTRQALGLKAKMLIEQGIVSRAFSDPKFPKFFEAISSESTQDIGFQISVLTLDEKLIAAEIGFKSFGAYVSHVGVYDLAYSRFAPGRLQIDRTVGASIAQGVHRYDFLAPDSEYKRVWCNKHVGVVDFGVPYTLAGRVFCNAAAAERFVVGSAKKGLPTSVLRYLARRALRK